MLSAIEPRHRALPMIDEIHTHLEALTAYTGALPAFLATLRDRFEATRTSHESIQHLAGRELINEHIAREHGAARKEIVSAQPGNRTADDLAYSFERDRAALKQGVSMRTIYHSSVRRVATVGNWAKEMAAAGGEIRTVNGRFPRSIIFDRRVAFVPVHTAEGEPPADEAVMISNPLAVAGISAVFDLFWERAEPWLSPTHGKDTGLTTTATQRAILRELCLGRTQAQAAKNLGISSAWVNNQLGELRTNLDMKTLNEVIYWWGKSPDHDVQD
ncbi:helix-turn-helix domain-containing protein [Actinacidiphila soli]|uniref:hypothetical protein n=1 Tax=Actinacidiphila soli TaxID=2487275 RepID=UPI000FC9D046|nr:hypothetical protein [Actinacidiphila soli]